MAPTGRTYENIAISGSARVHLGDSYTSESQDEKILEWLSPLDPWVRHRKACDLYQDGTLDWFLRHRTFQSWRDGTTNVLWCPGSMGTGKTILISRIIHHLRERVGQGFKTRVAFLYCQHERQREQTLPAVLGSLLSQLYHTSSNVIDIPPAVREAYEQRPAMPTLKQLQKWLQEAGQEGIKTFLILDGLDEIEQVRRDDLLESLPIQSSHDLHLLAASRDLPDIMEALGEPSVIHIRARDSDLKEYITSHFDRPSSRRFLRLIAERGRSPSEPRILRDKITDQIFHTSDGMFLLASLLVDLVLSSRTLSALRACLDTLPASLDQYYKDVWDRIIEHPDPRDVGYAKTALMWIVYAQRPLQWKELQHALLASNTEKAHTGIPAFEESLLAIEDIVSVCGGLITAPAGSSGAGEYANFIHFSAREYFYKHRVQYFPGAHDIISWACLKYMDLFMGQNGYLALLAGLRKAPINSRRANYRDLLIQGSRRYSFHQEFSLARYASENTCTHARYGSKSQFDVVKFVCDYPQLLYVAEDGELMVEIIPKHVWKGDKPLKRFRVAVCACFKTATKIMIDSGIEAATIFESSEYIYLVRLVIYRSPPENQDVTMIELLLKVIMNFKFRDALGRTQLHLAAHLFTSRGRRLHKPQEAQASIPLRMTKLTPLAIRNLNPLSLPSPTNPTKVWVGHRSSRKRQGLNRNFLYLHQSRLMLQQLLPYLYTIRYFVEQGADLTIEDKEGSVALPDWKIDFRDLPGPRTKPVLSFRINAWRIDDAVGGFNDPDFWIEGDRIYIVLRDDAVLQRVADMS